MSKRADRIKKEIRMIDFLFDYGYLQSNDQRKQQFRCDLHGDTRDDKPSARVYPEDDHAYCFACGVSRDVIAWAMEKEDLNFNEACRFLERRFDLDPWVFEVERTEVAKIDPEFNRAESLIQMALESSILSLDRAILSFEVLDRLKFLYQKGEDGAKIQNLLDKLREKVIGSPEKMVS